MKVKYFFYPGNDDVFFDALRDIDNVNETTHIRKNIYRRYQEKIIRLKNWFVFHVHNYKILNIINMLFLPLLNINNDLKSQGMKCFIFSNLTIRMIPYCLIKKLISRKDCKIIVYMIDSSINPLCREAIYLSQKFNFDKTYTFDKKDSIKYNLEHIYYLYSKMPIKRTNSSHKQIVFLGSDKGRLSFILDILDKLKENDISYDFSVVGVKDIDIYKFDNFDSVKLNSPIPYDEVIQKIQNYNVILDIVVDKQAGLSYRAIEAVCYNKRLLTNNPEIKEFPYYNPKYMKYFEKVEDIDWTFITDNSPVDYNYQNDYSPKNFLNKVSKEIFK